MRQGQQDWNQNGIWEDVCAPAAGALTQNCVMNLLGLVQGKKIEQRRPREDPVFHNVRCELTFGEMDDNGKQAAIETPPRTPRNDAKAVWQYQTIQLALDEQGVARSQPTRVSLEPETPHTIIPHTILRNPYAKRNKKKEPEEEEEESYGMNMKTRAYTKKSLTTPTTSIHLETKGINTRSLNQIQKDMPKK